MTYRNSDRFKKYFDTSLSKEDIQLIVGTRVKQLRIMRGAMTQQELAERIGKYREYISRLEGGEVPITIDLLIEVSAALNISIPAVKSRL